MPVVGRSNDYELFRGRHPAFMAEIEAHRRKRDHDLNKLSVLREPDRHARVRKLLRNQRLHVLYAFDALRKARQLGAATPETVRQLASKWNPFEVCRERTRNFYVPGRSRERHVVSFGPHRRMHQGLVAHIIRKLHPPLECQWLFRGGMPKALAAVEAAINEGYVYGAEVDVVQFYASVRRPTELAGILRPLPASVVQHVVWDTGVRRNPDSDFMSVSSLDDPSLSGLVGLAPGAATSAIVGEVIMGRMLAACCAVRLVAYADNVFVLGQTAAAVDACLEHLRNNAERLATGSLRLRNGEVRHLTGNSGVAAIPNIFSFLHHEGVVSRDDGISGRPLTVRWSPDQRKLDEYRLADNGAPINADTIDRIERKVSHWRLAYPSWPDGDLWEMQYLAELAALRYYDNPEPLYRSRAAHALILSYYAWGAERGFDDLLPAPNNTLQNHRRDQIADAAYHRLSSLEARHASPANGRSIS